MMLRELFRIERVEYRRGGRKRLASVSLRLFEGETLGVLGRHGSGAGSLARVLAGEAEPDAGAFFWENAPISSAKLARRVALIEGRSRLTPGLSLCENLFAAAPPDEKGRLIYHRRRCEKQCAALLARFGLDTDQACRVEKLPLSRQHILLSLRLMLTGRSALVLREIAAEYTQSERLDLLAHLRRLNEAGVSVIYTTSHWDSIVEQLPRLAVIRDGRCAKVFWDVNRTRELANAYVYGRIDDLRGKNVDGPRGGEAEAPLCELCGLSLRRGAFIGIFDSDGSSAKFVERLSEQARERNVSPALIRSNAFQDDWVKSFSLADNLLMPIAGRVGNRIGCIEKRVKRTLLLECCESLELSRDTMHMPMAALPREARIRLLFYRWRLRKPSFCLLVNPTMECSPSECEILHDEVVRVLDGGMPVIYISTSFRDIHRLTTRPLQIHRGEIGEVST
jgi:ABC-type sugar transport system ATPase subunit